MTQEIRVTARVRYPSSSIATRRQNEYALATQNLWAKALSVIGVGILLLLAYAIFPEVPLVIIGACVIILGLCLLAFDCLLKNKCKKSAQRRHGIQQSHRQRRPDPTSSQGLSQSATPSGVPGDGDDIWTSSVTMDWVIPPPTPPPVYSPTDPAVGLDIAIDHSDDDELSDDSVADLPIIFPIRGRRRCISTPPLPSYDEVIELDRREGRLSSSLPTLNQPTSHSSTLSSVTTSSSVTTPTTETNSMPTTATTVTTTHNSRGRSVSLPDMDQVNSPET